MNIVLYIEYTFDKFFIVNHDKLITPVPSFRIQ